MSKREIRLRTLLFERQGGYCHYCGQPMKPMPKLRVGPISKRTVTLEHLLPVSAGGLTTIANCVAVHRGCNEERGNMPLAEWDAILVARFEARR